MMIWIVPLMAAVLAAAGFLWLCWCAKEKWILPDAMVIAGMTLVIAAGTYALVWCVCVRIAVWINMAGI